MQSLVPYIIYGTNPGGPEFPPAGGLLPPCGRLNEGGLPPKAGRKAGGVGGRIIGGRGAGIGGITTGLGGGESHIQIFLLPVSQ